MGEQRHYTDLFVGSFLLLTPERLGLRISPMKHSITDTLAVVIIVVVILVGVSQMIPKITESLQQKLVTAAEAK